MFLGSREELEPDETQAFLETGTIHLLVISGLNVGILAGCLFLAMRVALVPRGWALAIVALASVLYAATTDAQPPVVRATVMVLVACLAMVLGRRRAGVQFDRRRRAWSCWLSTRRSCFKPARSCRFCRWRCWPGSPSGRASRPPLDPLERLIAGTPLVARATASRRLAADVVRASLVSLVIWLVICPLVMARFHLISPVAVVLGPVLGIPVALAMASGFGIFAVGWLLPPLAGCWAGCATRTWR